MQFCILSLSRTNYNRTHTDNQNTDDNTEKNQTDGVCIFQKLKGVLLGRLEVALKHGEWLVLNGPLTFGLGPVS
jgi:ABC-type uncharacterized transport system fused permease/ATPase subunit